MGAAEYWRYDREKCREDNKGDFFTGNTIVGGGSDGEI
jgi:hypothetical protein